MVRPTAVFAGVGVVGSVAGFDSSAGWYVLGALGIGLGAMFALIALFCPLTITLSGVGLTARDRGETGVVPSSAIKAVGISKVGRVNYVTLWYDTAAIPSLPSAFDRYLRSKPPSDPGRICVGVISPPKEAEKISELYRFVRETGLGEWRDYA
jgi:hypothetical protein